MRQSTKTIYKLTTISALTGISLLAGLAIVNPQSINFASAAEASANTAVNFTVDPVITITAPEEIKLDGLSPSTDPVLKTATGTVTVATNNSTGYNLTVSMADDATTSDLINTLDSSKVIANLDGEYTAENFKTNHWGFYDANKTKWEPLPAIGSSYSLKTTEGPTSPTDTTDFTVGTKIDYSTASGTYSNIIKFTAVANMPEPVDLTFDEAYAAFGKTKDVASGLYKMQDMSTEICDAVKTPTSTAEADTQAGTLVDIRNGNKTYKVAKLLDGKCWMTQNLDLNLDSSIPLTSADSDVTSSWAPQTTYTATSQWTSTSSDNLDSIDMGDYYYNGTTNKSQSASTSYANIEGFNTTGDQHYHVGNLYSWNAATANSRPSSAGAGEATDSICPKGWRLPKGGSTLPNEFSNMLAKYDAWSDGTTGTVQNLINGPIYMARGGYVSSGKLNVAAYYGYYWSSIADSPERSYYLYFYNTNNVNLSYYTYRYFGFALRCVAR